MKDLTVVILEDHCFQRKVAISILEKMGVGTILAAENGLSALKLIKEHPNPIDIAICDLQMDEMDGIEFIRRVGENHSVSSVIIASSMNPHLVETVSQMAKEYQIKVLGVLDKPIDSGHLSTLLLTYKHESYPRSNGRERPPCLPLSAIEEAIQTAQFTPFFQPIISIKGRAIYGAEALARLDHPTRGILPPATFIPVMEKHGLVDALTSIILDKSLREMKLWASRNYEPTISINLSPSMIGDTTLPDRLFERCQKYKIPPRKLVLEITESAVAKEKASFLEVLSRLRMKGFDLSIDDFGTGFSSLDQLSQLPFSVLKIDRSFIDGINTSGKRHAIVKSTIELARQLKMKSVVEGVENEEQLEIVSNLGANVVQGFLFGRPMPPADFLSWSQKWEKSRFTSTPSIPTKSVPHSTQASTSPTPENQEDESRFFKEIKRASLLILDDQFFVLRMMKEILEQNGARQIFFSSTIEEAKRVLKNEKCDLVISDLELEHENGLDLLKEIRMGKTAAPEDIPFLVLTSHATHRAIGISLALDASGFIVKPLKFQEVKFKIIEALKNRPPKKPPMAYKIIPTDFNSSIDHRELSE